MKFIFFLLAFFISGSNSFAQITDEAVQLVLTKKFRQFIIKGHTILDTATADFNNDGLRDIALVTSKKENGDASRAVMILQKTATGYIIAAKCSNAVLCAECGGIFGDPYAGISFTRNVLNITHYGGSAWRWSSNFTFRFQHKQWELIGISGDSYWNLGDCDGNGVGNAGRNMKEVNFSTKKMHIIETADTNCTPKTDKWVKIKSYRKITLDNFDVQEDYFKEIVLAPNEPSVKTNK